MNVTLEKLVNRQKRDKITLPATITLNNGRVLANFRVDGETETMVSGYLIGNYAQQFETDRVDFRKEDIISIDVANWEIISPI